MDFEIIFLKTQISHHSFLTAKELEDEAIQTLMLIERLSRTISLSSTGNLSFELLPIFENP